MVYLLSEGIATSVSGSPSTGYVQTGTKTPSGAYISPTTSPTYTVAEARAGVAEKPLKVSTPQVEQWVSEIKPSAELLKRISLKAPPTEAEDKVAWYEWLLGYVTQPILGAGRLGITPLEEAEAFREYLGSLKAGKTVYESYTETISKSEVGQVVTAVPAAVATAGEAIGVIEKYGKYFVWAGIAIVALIGLGTVKSAFK